MVRPVGRPTQLQLVETCKEVTKAVNAILTAWPRMALRISDYRGGFPASSAPDVVIASGGESSDRTGRLATLAADGEGESDATADLEIWLAANLVWLKATFEHADAGRRLLGRLSTDPTNPAFRLNTVEVCTECKNPALPKVHRVDGEPFCRACYEVHPRRLIAR